MVGGRVAPELDEEGPEPDEEDPELDEEAPAAAEVSAAEDWTSLGNRIFVIFLIGTHAFDSLPCSDTYFVNSSGAVYALRTLFESALSRNRGPSFSYTLKKYCVLWHHARAITAQPRFV